MEKPTIEDFLHAQVQAWNAGDREAFFAAYRSVAPQGLTIEYVGRTAPADGWPILANMWATQSAKVEIEEVVLIVNGLEATGHMRNKVRGTAMVIETIEFYRFNAGHLAVRYFIRKPAA
jgi:hypothetical protein